jgi:hypothetical protein
MRTLFDEPIYRVGKYLYQLLEDKSYRIRHVNNSIWDTYVGPVKDDDWKVHVLDKGVIDENAV